MLLALPGTIQVLPVKTTPSGNIFERHWARTLASDFGIVRQLEISIELMLVNIVSTIRPHNSGYEHTCICCISFGHSNIRRDSSAGGQIQKSFLPAPSASQIQKCSLKR